MDCGIVNDWLTRKQACSYMGISMRELNRLRHGKSGPRCLMRGGCLRYQRASCDRWLAARAARAGMANRADRTAGAARSNRAASPARAGQGAAAAPARGGGHAE